MATTRRQRAVERVESVTETDRSRPSRRERLRVGVAGGLIATLVMTAFRLPISRSLPPTAAFWAKYVGGGDAEDYPIQGLALHLLYGCGGGIGFALVAPVDGDSPENVAEWRGVLAGLVYGLVLSVFGLRVVLGRLLGMDLEADERLVFHVSHAVYGVTLGTWLGSRSSETPRLGR